MRLKKFKKYFLIIILIFSLLLPAILAFHFLEMKTKIEVFDFIAFSIISAIIFIAFLISVVRYNCNASYKAKMDEMLERATNRSFLKIIWNMIIWWTIAPAEKVSKSQKLSQKIFVLYIIIFILIIFFNA